MRKKKDDIELGVVPTGEKLGLSLSAPLHIAIQGQTRSGKSASAYHLISELLNYDNVKVSVIDPAGVLGAPLLKHPKGHSFVLGTDGNAGDYLAVVDTLVSLMRSRVNALLSAGLDKVTSWREDFPLHVLIVDELPGVIDFLHDDDAVNGRKNNARLAPRFQSGVRRLLAEGLKVGVMVILIAQRHDASLLSGAARSNIGLRICLKVEDSDAVRMLFPSADGELLHELVNARPGFGVVTSPEFHLSRVRLYHREYLDYVHHVSSVSAGSGVGNPSGGGSQ